MSWPQLSKPPIVEAVVGVRLPATALVDVAAIKALADRGVEGYPIVLQGSSDTFEARASASERTIAHRSNINAYAFTTLRGDCYFQARVDGFAFNVLQGYESWERIQTLAAPMLEQYAEAAGPSAIERVELRYLNRISVAQGTELDDLMQLRLVVPAQLPQRVGAALVRVMLPFEDFIVANVTSLMEPAPSGPMNWTVDIDVQDLEPLPAFDVGVIWRKLAKLREIKNQIFFSTVTEKALEQHR